MPTANITKFRIFRGYGVGFESPKANGLIDREDQ
jgi:hypothetical protein